MQPILPNLIGGEQATFIKGRDIFENVMLSQALVKGYGRKYLTPRCLMKVYIRKAFDTLQWSFIESMLTAFNFHAIFIKWVMNCVTGSWFSVKINGVSHGFFKDDLMIFTRGDLPSFTAVVHVLNKFGRLSGLIANPDKTSIYFGGVHHVVQSAILDFTKFSPSTFPFRYIGVPLNVSRLCLDHFGSLITKMQGAIQHWISTFLSCDGRLQLINSVLLGLQTYWCSTILLPNGGS
ncbi:uncharacterized protein LOC141641639 [Silene latifolia]|uniref:uncharacterized protein LOC141641639 n=1 Tax=Silene latifolia TaxID=37657 RepID=UPI003D77486C